MTDLRKFPPVAEALRKHPHTMTPHDPQPLVYRMLYCMVHHYEDEQQAPASVNTVWYETLEGSTKCAHCGDQRLLRDMCVAYKNGNKVMDNGLLCRPCAYRDRSTHRKTIQVCRLQKTLSKQPDLHNVKLEVDLKNDLKRLRQEMIYYEQEMDFSEMEIPTQFIREMLIGSRVASQWITYTSRKRNQKKCGVITQELIETIWHPQRIQRFGWDIEMM
jgi:uncharacterized cysteine cluster protein YcgN (CxxCxxCC family)